MSDRAFIPILVVWMLAVLVLSVPLPALFARITRRIHAERNAHASSIEIKRQVQAAEARTGKGSSLPTQG